jgi:hypothetical protein
MTRWFPLLVLAACAGSDATDPVDTDSGVDSPTETDTDTDTSPEEPAVVVLAASLVDAAGAPLSSGFRVQYCRGIACFVGEQEASGAYVFSDLPAGPGSFEVFDITDPPTHVTVFAPITVDGATRRELTVTVPNMTPTDLPATVGEVTFGGCHMEVGAGSLSAGSPLDPDPTSMAVVRATTPLPVENGPTGEVLGVWYVWPFDAEAEDGIPLAIDNTWGVASGEASLWFADYDTSTWIELGDMTEDAGRIGPPTPLPKLTTFALVRKP